MVGRCLYLPIRHRGEKERERNLDWETNETHTTSTTTSTDKLVSTLSHRVNILITNAVKKKSKGVSTYHFFIFKFCVVLSSLFLG